jgi:hypothetical protein
MNSQRGPSVIKRSLSLHHNRHLFRFLGGRFISAIADQLLMFAIPLIVYQQTKSVLYSGLTFAAEWGNSDRNSNS